MPRRGTPLTDTAIRSAKPQAKAYNLYDTQGLYLTVSPTGPRWWRFKYRFELRERRMGLGTHPEVTLAAARKLRDAARALLREGKDPQAQRQAEKLAGKAAHHNTFAAMANRWLQETRVRLEPASIEKNAWLLSLVMSDLGSRALRDIKAPDILTAIDKIKARGRRESARRAQMCVKQVFAFAIERRLLEHNPVGDLRRAVKGPKPTARAAVLQPDDVRRLLLSIEGFQGQPTTLAALRLAPLVFVRPGELRQAEWSEIDLTRAEWNIPAAKMKMRAKHLVPLSKQAMAILKALKPLTGRGKYCFPSVRTPNRPMSENTVNAALRAMGYPKEQMTGHGFRAIASTLLNELGWKGDIIEKQLAHAPQDKVRAAYHRSEYIPERRKMMQAWADHLDELKSAGEHVE